MMQPSIGQMPHPVKTTGYQKLQADRSEQDLHSNRCLENVFKIRSTIC